MRLYYSGALGHLQTQVNPAKSIGGYISSSAVPNDLTDAIFDELSDPSLIANRYEYICLILQNQLPNKVSNILLGLKWLSEEVPLSNIQAAAAVPTLDKYEDPVFELLSSRYSQPLGVNFQDITISPSLVTILPLSSIAIGDILDIHMDGVSLALTSPLDSVENASVYNKIIQALQSTAFEGIISKKSTLNGTSVVTQELLEIVSKTDGVMTNVITIINTTTSTTIFTQALSGGVDQSINIGELLPNRYIALWLRRKPTDKARLKLKGQGSKSCDALLLDFLTEKSDITFDNFALQIEWTVV